MTPVTRDQFEIRSDVEVVHIPTRARFTTYQYVDPKHAASSLTINWGHAGDVDNGEDYDRSQIGEMAVELLKEQANKAK